MYSQSLVTMTSEKEESFSGKFGTSFDLYTFNKKVGSPVCAEENKNDTYTKCHPKNARATFRVKSLILFCRFYLFLPFTIIRYDSGL